MCILFSVIDQPIYKTTTGFPNVRFFSVVLSVSVVNSLVMLSLSGIQSYSNGSIASFGLSLLSFIFSITTVILKVLAEKITGLDTTVVTMHDLNARSKMIDSMNLKLKEAEIELKKQQSETKQKELEISQLKEARRMALEAANRTKEFDTSIKYADETLDVMKTQLTKKGVRALEFIPLAELNAEIDVLVGFASRGEQYDEDRLDHLFECRKINKEYIAMQELEAKQWREESAVFVKESLVTMRGFVPPSIFTDTRDELTKAGVSEALAKRFERLHCLRLVRMNPGDIGRLHESLLSGEYNAGKSQKLDIVELAAVYGSMPQVFPNDSYGKKREILRAMEMDLKEMMSQLAKGTLPPEKLRAMEYSKQAPMFDRRISLFTRAVVSSEGVYEKRTSFASSKDKPSVRLDLKSTKFEHLNSVLNRQVGGAPPPLPKESRAKVATSQNFSSIHTSLASLFGAAAEGSPPPPSKEAAAGGKTSIVQGRRGSQNALSSLSTSSAVEAFTVSNPMFASHSPSLPSTSNSGGSSTIVSKRRSVAEAVGAAGFSSIGIGIGKGGAGGGGGARSALQQQLLQMQENKIKRKESMAALISNAETVSTSVQTSSAAVVSATSHLRPLPLLPTGATIAAADDGDAGGSDKLSILPRRELVGGLGGEGGGGGGGRGGMTLQEQIRARGMRKAGVGTSSSSTL